LESARGLFLFSVLLSAILLFGCTTTQIENDIALAVWQHKDADFEPWYSIYKHSARRWQTSEGATAPIARMAGDDNDPDVSSKGAYAVSVWENGGRIFSSEFDGKGGFEKAKWSSSPNQVMGANGRNSDPTVAVIAQSSAFASWVSSNDGGSLEFSYWDGRAWNSPTKVSGSELGALPEMAAFGRGFVLAWAAPEGVKAAVFSAGKWQSPATLLSAGALYEKNIPADSRLGVATRGSEAIVVWTAKGGRVLYSKFSEGAWSPAKEYSSESSPDVADFSGGFYSVFEKSGDLSGTDFSSVDTVSKLEKSDLRPAVAFISNKAVGVSVWWNPIDAPGEIYYSSKDAGAAWAEPARVNVAELPGFDRNPAITPLEKTTIYEEPFCPNGVIDPGEQCEMGIPCANPNAVCNVWNCMCIVGATPTPTPTPVITSWPSWPPFVTPNLPTATPGTPTSTPSPTPSRVITPRCGDGFVSTPNSPGGGDEECDIGGRYVKLNLSAERIQCGPQKLCINCKCVSMGNVSCAGNTREQDITGSQRFISRGMSCYDDCKSVYGDKYECNTNSCTCAPKSATPTPGIYVTPQPTVTEVVPTPQPTVSETTPQPTTTASPTPMASPSPTPVPTATPTPSPTPCPDADQDGKCDSQDNCPHTVNPNQADADGDGIGDYCDTTPVSCSNYCSSQGGYAMAAESSSLQQGTTQYNAQSCAALLTEEPYTCTTVCKFSKFQQWLYSVNDQVVNSYGCCCKKVFWLPCTNCPAQAPSQPNCPTQDDCTAAEPGKTSGAGAQ
jgi:hypothetical protein